MSQKYKLGCHTYKPPMSIEDINKLEFKKVMARKKIPFDIGKNIYKYVQYCQYAKEGGCEGPTSCLHSGKDCTGFSENESGTCNECYKKEQLWLDCCREGWCHWCDEEPTCPDCWSCTIHCICNPYDEHEISDEDSY